MFLVEVVLVAVLADTSAAQDRMGSIISRRDPYARQVGGSTKWLRRRD